MAQKGNPRANQNCTSLCTSKLAKHGTYGKHGKARADCVNLSADVSYFVDNELRFWALSLP